MVAELTYLPGPPLTHMPKDEMPKLYIPFVQVLMSVVGINAGHFSYVVSGLLRFYLIIRDFKATKPKPKSKEIKERNLCRFKTNP